MRCTAVPPHKRAAAQEGRALQHGASFIELLAALPVLLLLGMGALQWALLLHAKASLNLAVHEAARAASVEHADPAAAEAGFARGLAPWLFGAHDIAEATRNEARARAHVAAGQGQGWIRIEQLSPSRGSFADWGVPATDLAGNALGVVEIPNDSLAARAVATLPAGGASRWHLGMPVGPASEQTLLDANVLKLEVTYGVPLSVPVVGALIARTMAAIDGCGAIAGLGPAGVPAAASTQVLGTVRLAPFRGAVGAAIAEPRPWRCAFYGARDADGAARPRMPVLAGAVVRMQSGAREGGRAVFVSAPAASLGPSLGAGEVQPGSVPRLIRPSTLNPQLTLESDPLATRGEGFLRFGAERPESVPDGFCSGTGLTPDSGACPN